MSKKYELTNESKVVNGCTIYRIKALKDFGDVEKGNIGGYIQSEKIYLKKMIAGYLIMLKYVEMLKYMKMLDYMIMQ